MSYLQVEVRVEHLGAQLTAKTFLASVDLNMLVEVCPLGKTEGAIFERAHIRAFIRMNA